MRTVWIALACACACASPPTTHESTGSAKEQPRVKDTAMPSILDVVGQLAEKLPFQQADVARITGNTLARDVSTSNSSYDMFASTTANPPYTSVEVRSPTGAPAGKNGLVLLGIRPDPCIREKDVIARYGEPEISPPSPHGPADAPTYYLYKQPWGELRLGFSRDDVECLVAIVLDAS